MKARVFVSSVIEGFEAYRNACREGIVHAGCEPVLVEDFPSISYSPRTACLDGVASCDVLVLVIGSKGGWVTPSGKLVVEEELEEARRRGLNVFIYIQETDHDEAAKRLVKSVSDYVHGFFRRTFRSTTELQTLVEESLRTLEKPAEGNVMQIFNEALSVTQVSCDEASLRFLLACVRKDDLLTQVVLEDENFKDLILQLAHSREVRLFSYENAKSFSITVDSLVVHQTHQRGQLPIDEVRLEITSTGSVLIDANVTNLVKDESNISMHSYYVIVEEDIQKRLLASFAFCKAFLDSKDPYRRHQQFLFNAVLHKIGHRSIVQNRPSGRTSYSIGFGDDTPIIAFDRPRQLSRTTLDSPREEIEAIVTMFRRRTKQR